MESLCDQRVLERLEGEERREYGALLLGMANEKYARAPGTTSVSNGGKNIAKRIAAIVRFKKYPKKMALVSVCVVIVLGSGCISGMAATYKSTEYFPDSELGFCKSMAISRTVRCKTAAGAMDTYAKGLILENGVYLAVASPVSEQRELIQTMEENRKDGLGYCYIKNGFDFGAPAVNFMRDADYRICNIDGGEDGSYTALLVIGMTGEEYNVSHFDEDNDTDVNAGSELTADMAAEVNEDVELTSDRENGTELIAENGMDTDDDLDQSYDESDTESKVDSQYCVYIPIEVRNEDGWVVEEKGVRQIMKMSLSELEYDSTVEPAFKTYSAQSENGIMSAKMRSVYKVNNETTNSNIDMDMYTNMNGNMDIYGNVFVGFDTSIKPDAGFEIVHFFTKAEFVPGEQVLENDIDDFAGYQLVTVWSDGKIQSGFEEVDMKEGGHGGADREGFMYRNAWVYGDEIHHYGDKTVVTGNKRIDTMFKYGAYFWSSGGRLSSRYMCPPQKYLAKIYIDGEFMEDMELSEVN